jgi:hypothetical protein
MADLKLDFVVVPTYSTFTMAVADASTYPSSGSVSAPSMKIGIPGGFDSVVVPFNINDVNVYNSTILGITGIDGTLPIPDGIYSLTYSVAPAYENYVTKTIMRVDQLQEKFDSAFMKLDMMECDLMIKKQQKVVLDSIYYFIQGSIAAANNCAVDTATKLYNQAENMLDNFIRNNCYCSGNNYVTNFY